MSMKRKLSVLTLTLAVLVTLLSPALAAEAQSVRATLPVMQDIFVEGVKVDFLVSNEGKYPPFSYDGTVYIPLMTAGRWLGADPVWDEKAKTVTIISNKTAPIFDTVTGLLEQGIGFQWGSSQYDVDKAAGVDAQLRPDVTVTVNGQKKALCPLLLRGYIYLPLQSVAQLLGKEILQYGGDLYLYQAPTEEELAQANATLAAVHSHLDAVRAAVTGAKPDTEKAFTARVKEVQSLLKAAADLPSPAFSALRYDWNDLHYWLEWTLTKLVEGYLPPEESGGTSEAQGEQVSRPSFLFSSHTVEKKWDSFASHIIPNSGYDTYFLYAERQCAEMEQLLSAIGRSPVRSPSGGETPFTPEVPSAAEDFPASGTAYTATQSVLVDGKAVEFQCYALKDARGDPTNYVKLRDVALALNGTAARFSVGWDGAVNIERGKSYTPNGSEMSTPFSGDRAYEKAGAETRIDGKSATLNAIVLIDDRGGAYTYYKLRDLGAALGFWVDWSAEMGIFIETK